MRLKRIRLSMLVGLAFLSLLWSCASSPAATIAPTTSAAAPPDIAGTVDFPALSRFSQSYSCMRYDSNAQIYETMDRQFDKFLLVDLPETKNRYMLGTLTAAKRQEIWIRGTANFKNAVYDMRFRKHFNEKLGINLHEGFEQMAMAVYADILPHLRPDYDTVIFGHSLGAAEAVILGMLLETDHFKVTQVYASGQPRVTDGAGETKFDALPILRIVNEGDPVPFLPPRDIPSAKDPYQHLGTALVLLDGPYYCLLDEDVGDDLLAADFWKTLAKDGAIKEVDSHFIKAYLGRLEPKLKAPIQVPYADRAKYLAKAN
jgi:hypothetical protein